MSKGYLIFSIGPVQTFIEKARKAQDLYAGSFLLSHLSAVAWEELKAAGLSPIYPTVSSQSLPNVMLFECEREKAEEAARRAKEKVKKEWDSILSRVLPAITPNTDDQVRDFPEIYWAWGERVAEAQILHGAVKKLKQFSQIEEDHRSLKCSICGEREALFYRKENGRLSYLLQKSHDHVLIVSSDDEKIFKLKHLAPGEGLCALCLVKRRLEKAKLEGFESKFPSTAELALLDAMENHRETFDEFRSYFEKNFNHQLYYEENLTEEYFKKEGVKAKPGLQELREKHHNLFKGIFLPKYYAVFMADGDSMGKKLASMEPDLIPDFSSKLLNFSGWVRKEIKEPYGRVIYAGGDDLLVFLNLKKAIERIKEIRKAFPDGLTLSASLTIAHYKQPLSQVLRIARAALKEEAKKVRGKNALAIAVIRHSGERTLSLLKWEALEEVEGILKALLDGEASTNFIYSLKRLAAGMELPQAPLLSLAKAFIRRSLGENGNLEKLYSNLSSLYEKMKIEKERGNFSKKQNFFQLLDNIAFLRRELKEGR